MGIATDLADLKELSDGVVANKVSRFAPQNMSLWHEDYFDIKAIKTEKIQKTSLPPHLLPSCLNFHWKEGL